MPRVVMVAALAALLTAPAPVRAKCAMPVLEPQVLAHPGDEIPAGGGILVGWTTSTDWSKARGGDDPALRLDWHLHKGEAAVGDKPVRLAPGLVVYRPRRASKARTLELRDGDGAVIGEYRFVTDKRAPPASAPELRAVDVTREDTGRARRTRAVVTLDAAPPEGAYALVIREAGGDPIAWAPVSDPAATSITVFSDRGRCDVHPPDLRAPLDGEKLEAVWVDRFGQVGPASKPVTATARTI